MLHRHARIALALILPLLLLSFAAPARAAWPDADQQHQIDALVQQAMQQGHIPGIAVGIVEDGRTVYLKGFGQADAGGRPVTPQTPFMIGSLSKSFTGLAALQMVEAGKLDLDAPVQRYLPWFRVADGAASAQITVRHLLNHTTGIPRSEDAFLGALDQHHTSEWVVRGLADVGLAAAPGARYEYSNLNYITASLIIETVSGVPYDRYVSEQILAPLQMTHSFTAEAPALADGLATGHISVGGLWPLAHRVRFSPSQLGSGSLITSAEDMTHYLLALMHDGRYEGRAVLPPQRVAELFAPGAPTAPYKGAPTYGLGWVTAQRVGETLYEHQGSSAGFHSAMAMLPGRSRGVIILSNAGIDATDAVARLEEALITVMRDQMAFLAKARVPASSYLTLIIPPLVLLWLIADAMLLPRWRRRVRVRGARWSDWALAGLSLVLALVCLAGVPLAMDATLLLMWAVLPTVAVAIWAAGGLALATFGWRVAVLWKRQRRGATASLR
ncbi:MAG: class beta-lactamase-related serine hydrolase [Symbiobacteriaceae bacterium]|jgi:CubicO group peptidase (beta-lactamase class C family)|nr:class beta-lactamase-related serine hydrolase [Symbiobacteriaceae bacterium]